MKKLRILSIMLALIILSSAFAMTGNAAYTGGDSVKEIATIKEIDDSAYNSGLDELKLMDINLKTFDQVVFNDGYEGGHKETYSSGNVVSSSEYYYNVSENDVDDLNIAVFKFRNCGVLKSQPVDVYIYIDRVVHSGSTGESGKMPLLRLYQNYTSTYGSFSQIGDEYQEITLTLEVRSHVDSGDGEIIRGEKIYSVFSDLDGKNSVISEGFEALEGHTNNYLVYKSCSLNVSNDNGKVKWESPTRNDYSGSASYINRGVYAETDGNGRYTSTHFVGGFGVTVDMTQSILPTYSLTVDPNGGTWNSSTDVQHFSDFSEKTKTIANPTRAGFTFDGWEFVGAGTFENDIYTYGDGNATLTAKWTPIEGQTQQYVIKYVSVDNGETTYYRIEDAQGTHHQLQGILVPNRNGAVKYGVPQQEGKIFAGWYETEDDASRRDPDGAFDHNENINIAEKAVNGALTLYAGWVEEGTPTKASADKNNYGKTTLNGFALEGVQIRGKDIKDPYTDEYNKVYDGLRFLTVYANQMMTDLDEVSSSDVKYGYAVAAKGRLDEDLPDFTLGTTYAKDVDCTKTVADMDHRHWNDYRLSTVVIKYETSADQAKLGEEVLARPYIKYTDANGYSRVAYDTYIGGTSTLGGGCYTSMNNAVAKMAPFISQS